MSINKLLYKNRKQFLVYLIGVLMVTPANILVTLGLANAFRIFETASNQEIINVIGLSLILCLSPILLQLISRYLRIGFTNKIIVEIREMSYEKFISTSPDNFRNHTKEKFLSEMTSDINLFEQDFFLSILNISYAFGSFILGLFILYTISPLLSIFTFLVAIALFIISKIYENPSRKMIERVQKENSKFHSALSNVLKGLESIKLNKVESKFQNIFNSDVSTLEEIKRKSAVLMDTQGNLMKGVRSFFQILSFIYAAYLLSMGQILLTQMVIIMNLMGQMTRGLTTGFSFINRLKTSIDLYNRITYNNNLVDGTKSFNLDESIVISNLSFAYESNNVLNNLNLNIPKGNKVLISGPSGTGKTTLLECISKNINDYQGDILYDDNDLRYFSNASFWNRVAYARQEHFIFDDSISNNIVLTKDFDSDKFYRILEALSLKDWVLSLQEKEDHLLTNNGNNISGGQRQRISLARELYQEKELIFFDEPSASLDDETARKIYEYILNLNKTVICVSHRHLDYLKEKFNQSITLEKEVDTHG